MTPPLPPNCEDFICERDGRLEAALVFPLDFHVHPATEPFNAHQRKIVAAYCRCAWLDEAERLSTEWRIAFDAGNKPQMDKIERERFAAAASELAWKKWGQE